jgi:hypothetical protein
MNLHPARALQATPAGMRFIAQATLYNAGNWPRLAQFIEASYTAEALAEQSARARLAEFKAEWRMLGRLRVERVIATDRYHVVLLVVAEHTPAHFLVDFQVEAAHPHRITRMARVNVVDE